MQDQGGWTSRATVEHFAHYASVVAARLGERVARWITHNEPLVVAAAGHFTGEQAPVFQDPAAFVVAGAGREWACWPGAFPACRCYNQAA